ncbi:MAG: RbsD/FucU domain-containing protein [Cypionkella sp.]|uniref:RbsD/FucU family protein n=1 Tax=Cypionkella sp. TaxID=2811411 RepID=UPI002ABB7993|nr:RbsD/FucU domain-containing protein [Cypionkella sp.]MDZ4309859.1 RbsD/FucU domain-containing protein [Cypionkella sp.]MDZ4395719.1 RbsD/FucU domain-containing protein [Cypionkella sp.]
MLIGISPLLGPDLLHALRAMGHGDEIALVDGNYPAAEHARRLIRADGILLMPMLRAVLKILPVEAAFRSSLNNDPAQRGVIHHGLDDLCHTSAQRFTLTPLDGDQLYPRIRAAYAIIATSEAELFANVILRKAALPASVSE